MVCNKGNIYIYMLYGAPEFIDWKPSNCFFIYVYLICTRFLKFQQHSFTLLLFNGLFFQSVLILLSLIIVRLIIIMIFQTRVLVLLLKLYWWFHKSFVENLARILFDDLICKFKSRVKHFERICDILKSIWTTSIVSCLYF